MKIKNSVSFSVLILFCFCCSPEFVKKDHNHPLIGVTSVYDTDKSYVETAYVNALRKAGGIPVILPPLADDPEAVDVYCGWLDGLLLVGGRDIPPGSYGEKPHQTVEVLPAIRFEFESRLVSAWLNSGKPLLGICLGSQLINVMSGGTLIQDIPSQITSNIRHRGGYSVYHTVYINKGTRLHDILGVDSMQVNSAHHQAVKKPGKGLLIAARAPDGVIEAIEKKGERFVLGVQWHPEYSAFVDKEKIYSAFVEAVIRYKNEENQ